MWKINQFYTGKQYQNLWLPKVMQGFDNFEYV